MPEGSELSTEWVVILPETATFVKKLKEFKPPPIPVEIEFSKSGDAAKIIDKKVIVKDAKEAGKAAGDAIVSETKKSVEAIPKDLGEAGKKSGESFKREVIKPIAKVNEEIENAIAPKDSGKIRTAIQRVGQTLRESLVRDANRAGDEVGKKLAQKIEQAKGAVTRAERSLADARVAASNIESRVRQQEARVQQLREASAAGLRNVVEMEARYNKMRAESSKHSTEDIKDQERKLQAARQAHQNKMIQLNASEESQSRLLSSRATVANRTANAVENLGSKEAALAATLALNNPLDDAEDLKRASGGMMSSLVPMGRQLLVTTGLFTGALGLGGAITSVINTGNTFTDTMNRMQGILGSSGAEIGQLNAKARELGRDFTLPATSANDAALAMLELTKAGFSARQSMDAARGALQLSAAAGIDAAQAATITGTSLNAFGLEAKEAGRVTDLLAQAANLFPGEMTDFGYSLSQAGAVAKSFGINIEDTTTALGFLAKAGIKSSDAGTLIKTMLLSLTDSGKPAQTAIKELGLELYDQAGKFKGLEYVYKRLNQASKELTQEQYQAATATLFGTDAARFAGLAAGESAPKWDDFRSKIDDAGAAARVANARLQGLPGAIEKLKNAGQSLGLTLYDSVSGPLTTIVTIIAKATLGLDNFLSGAVSFLSKFKEEILGVVAVFGTYITVIGTVKGAIWAWTQAQVVLNAVTNAHPVTKLVTVIAALVAGVIYAYKNFSWFRTMINTVWEVIKTGFLTGKAIITAAWEGIAAGAKWLWYNVLQSVFSFISAGWKILWFAIQVGWKLGQKVFEAVGDVMQWVWRSMLQPIWERMKAGWRVLAILWQKVYDSIIHPLLETLGDMYDWLQEKLQAFGEKWGKVWDGIKAVVQKVWDFLKPVRDWVGDFFDTIGDLGQKAAEAIRNAWSGLTDILKEPLRALGRFLAGIPDSIMGVEIPFVADLRGWGESLAGLRAGGIIRGPGTGTSDSILGLTNGIPSVRVSNGEGIVPKRSLDNPMGQQLFSMLLAMGRSGIPGFAMGGRIGEWMSNFQGTPWVLGGFSQAGIDCSGLVSAAVNVSMGRNWNQGPPGGSPRTATATEAQWLSAQGFKRGPGTAGTLRVGFKNGGPAGGHTAGTFPDGTNFESGQNGVQFGSRAMGASDFPEQWYLPREADLSGVSGGSSNFLAGRSGAFSSSGIYGGGAGGPASLSSTGDTLGGIQYDSRKIREAEDRVTDRQNQLNNAQTRLNEFLAKQAEGKDVKQSTIDTARTQVEKFTRELEEAQTDLETAKQGEYRPGRTSRRSSQSSDGTGEEKQSGNGDWSSVGGMIFGGFMEAFGFDGSVLKNLFDTPTFKSAMAGTNFGLNLLTAALTPTTNNEITDNSSVFQPGVDVLAGMGEQVGLNFPHGDQVAQGGSPGTGNGGVTWDLRGSQLGVSPGAMEDKIGELTAANRRHPMLGP